MKKYILTLIACLVTTLGFAQTYIPGQTINIKANFNAPLGANSQMVVKLNNNINLTLNIVDGSSLKGIYTVTGGVKIPDLSILSIESASIFDTLGNNNTSYKISSSFGNLVAENSLITRNLGDAENIGLNAYFVKIPVPAQPYGISPPVGSGYSAYIYVACQGSNQVARIGTYGNEYGYYSTQLFNVGVEPYGLNLVTVGGVTYVYVANTGSDTVTIINTSTGVIDTVPVGVKPYYVAVSGTKVYVTNSLTNDVSVIDATTKTVVATIPVGTYPRSLAFHGTNLFVANYGDVNYGGGNSVSVLNTVNNTNTVTIPLPLNHVGPRGVTLARGAYIFVANYLSNNVTLINPVYNKVFPTTEDGQTGVPSSIAVGKGPRGIISANSVNKVFVENFDDGTITVINSLTFAASNTIKVGHSPSGMSLVGNTLYVSSFQDNCLYLVDITNDTVKIVPGTPQY